MASADLTWQDFGHAAGISYRRFDYWVRKGYIPAGTPGSGKPRCFTESEAQAVIRIAKLVRGGFTPRAAAARVGWPTKIARS